MHAQETCHEDKPQPESLKSVRPHHGHIGCLGDDHAVLPRRSPLRSSQRARQLDLHEASLCQDAAQLACAQCRNLERARKRSGPRV